MSSKKTSRMLRELSQLEREPTPGVTAWPRDIDSLSAIDACITAPKDTPYEGGVFKLEVTVPDSENIKPKGFEMII